MLKEVHLEGIGPSLSLGPIFFAKRLNFITGDNGLGKSFILDICWWVLTRNWARGVMATPPRRAKTAAIKYSYSKRTKGDFEDTVKFDKKNQYWPNKPGRPPIPGIVIYAGADGNFSVWDPARNYWTDKDAPYPKPISFDFSPDSVWRGLRDDEGVQFCKGLIQDWVFWQESKSEIFEALKKVLLILSPSSSEKIVPGPPIRIGMDVTDYPTLRMPYGDDVAIIHASSGMRRICALAYLLVWTWSEHIIACEQTGRSKAKEIIFLIDEIECHLHPQWQRKIVPSLLGVMKSLTGKRMSVQTIVATHAPLVLASIEAEFDSDIDAIFTLELDAGKVNIINRPYSKQGDVTNWLVSEAFGLKQARSLDAEEAIEAAEQWMRGDRSNLPTKFSTVSNIHRALAKSLPGSDPFWPRWLVTTNQL